MAERGHRAWSTASRTHQKRKQHLAAGGFKAHAFQVKPENPSKKSPAALHTHRLKSLPRDYNQNLALPGGQCMIRDTKPKTKPPSTAHVTFTTSPPSTFINCRKFCCRRLVLDLHFSNPRRSTANRMQESVPHSHENFVSNSCCMWSPLRTLLKRKRDLISKGSPVKYFITECQHT